jgi:ADP-heptose:LPS heptosyltransferase
MSPGPRILIIRFSSLGVVVLAAPLVRAIHARHPEVVTTFAVSTRFADLQVGNPAVARRVRVSPGDRIPAVGRPVVTLAGPAVRAFGFFPYLACGVVLERPLVCRPCSPFGSDHCPLGHDRCMIEIAPAAVYDAVERAA